jgi:hypothetical protein
MFGPDKAAHDGGARGVTPWSDIFEPDALLPTEFFATFRPEGGWERERLLLFAVLADAVECYQKYALDPRGHETFAETEAWLNSDDRSSLFAFETLCDALGIEPEYLRRGLREWRERRRAAVPRVVVPRPVRGRRLPARRCARLRSMPAMHPVLGCVPPPLAGGRVRGLSTLRLPGREHRGAVR